MYANNSKSALEALCILLDEKEGKEIAFVQFPQFYDNLTRNDLYGSMMRVIAHVRILDALIVLLILLLPNLCHLGCENKGGV